MGASIPLVRLATAIAALALGAVPLIAASCSSAPALEGSGQRCFQTTDCQLGLACVPQPDGTRICSSDLTSIQTLPMGGADATTMDATPAPDAPQPDDSTAPSDTGTPGDTGTPDDTGSSVDTGSPPPDTGTAPDTSAPLDTGSPQEASPGDDSSTD